MNLVPTLPTEYQHSLDLLSHPIFATDSYKLSHFLQYNPSGESIYSHYINRTEDEEVYFTGLDYIIKTYLSEKFTTDMFFLLNTWCNFQGIPCNHSGFLKLLYDYDGYLPVTITAVPENNYYPSKLPLFTVTNNGGADMLWCVGIVETLLMKVWYPSAVATKAGRVHTKLSHYFRKSSQCPEANIKYSYHNFGARGSCTEEQSLLGGMAHLHVFSGTDNFKSVIAYDLYYKSKEFPSLSIPATEHSTTCSVGKENEFQFVLDHVNTCISLDYHLMAAVVDTYDTEKLVNLITAPDSPIRAALEESRSKLVLRPDSGDPVTEVTNVFRILKNNGCLHVNSKGYWTSDHFSVLWGDGATLEVIDALANNWVYNLQASMDILAFGSGGDLIQSVSRDTHKTAIKASAILVNNKWEGISKEPIAEPFKKSLKGRVVTCKVNNKLVVMDMDSPEYDQSTNIMKVVYNYDKD
jgi:nicotinamide phosphoribosyltransferase